MRIQLLLGALLLLSTTCAEPVNASRMYSAGLGLHLINQATGQPSLVMSIPGAASDLAGDGPFVWAALSSADRLLKIRPSTQEVLSNTLLSLPVKALAIDPQTSMFVGVSGSNLVEINPATGEVT